MIFGNAEFMEMPFEPIIKEFRGCDLLRERNSLDNYADAFFVYLQERVKVGIESQRRHVKAIFMSSTQPLLDEAIEELFKDRNRKNESLADRMGNLFIEKMRKKIAFLENKDDSASLSDISSEELSKNTPISLSNHCLI